MRLLTIQEVAELLRVPTARVYDLIRQNLIPHIHLGRQLRVEESQLLEFIRNGGKALPGGWKHEV